MAEPATSALAPAIQKESMSDMILEPIENLLDKYGLMDGPMAPLKRTAIGGGIGLGVMYLWKPEFAFDKNGQPYPWSITHKSIDRNKTTLVPYWLAASIPAVVLGVLI